MVKRVKTLELSIFLISFVLYLALAAWMTGHWKTLGDEPHYLLAAHSLVADRDLDLANNYAQRDFQNYLEGETLDPHVKVLPNGAHILNHDLGLPLVLALPYALGGRAGVEFFLAFCGALLAWQMWKLAFDVTRDPLWSTVSWFALAFTPPLVLYAALIYPEVIGALIFVWSTRTILLKSPAHISRLELITLACGIVLLPWLSIRFVILVALLLLFVVAQWRADMARVFPILITGALAVVAYFFINRVLLAGTVPQGSPTDLASGNLASLSPASIGRGIVGWWIDPQRGTLIIAPVYILALAGIPRLLRANLRVGILLVSPLIVLIPLVAMLGGFWIPFEVGARYFVIALTLLVAPLALALQAGFNARAQWQRVAFGGFASLLVGLSLWNGALMITDASYAYGSVVSAYSRVVGNDLSPFFSGMGRALIISPQNAPPSNPNVTVQDHQGEKIWRAQAGHAGTIIQSFDLTELTVGHYVLGFRAGTSGATTDAEVLSLDLYSAEGVPLVHSSWRASELKNGSLERVALDFDNPYFDRWGFPLTLQVTTTGEAELMLSAMRFDPDNSTTWLRAGIWIAFILTIILVLNLDLLNPQSRLPIAHGPRRA